MTIRRDPPRVEVAPEVDEAPIRERLEFLGVDRVHEMHHEWELPIAWRPVAEAWLREKILVSAKPGDDAPLKSEKT